MCIAIIDLKYGLGAGRVLKWLWFGKEGVGQKNMNIYKSWSDVGLCGSTFDLFGKVGGVGGENVLVQDIMVTAR